MIDQLNRRNFLKTAVAGSALMPSLAQSAMASSEAKSKPNIIFILADDLGYNELGCYGQEKIKTPNLDQMAEEGMRFTQYYCGQAVCAPSRCVLMTGKHTGHSYIRNNSEVKPEGQLPIPEDSQTIAEMLKEQGYATATIGKWGLGPPGSSGDPNKQGFDLFFGYNCQRHAHNYYPKYLYRNSERVPLPGNDRGLTGEHYAPDLMIDEALQFIQKNQDQPFFLYYPTPVPHLALQVPEDSLEEYKGKWPDPPYDGTDGYLPHPNPRAAYAAMITRMDRDIGRIMQRLKDLNLDDNTIVMFSSDNGATFLRGPDTDFFESNKPLRGKKGSLYEGGIRVPMIARWPGRIPAGTTTDHISAFWDVMPTVAELTGGEVKSEIDGISFLPTLRKQSNHEKHDYMYWEFSGYGGQQAIRMGKWKAIRTDLRRKKADHSWELYNLEEDIGETNNVADKHPEIMEKIKEIAKKAHVPSEKFPMAVLDNEN